MDFSYKIIYDIEIDMENWHSALNEKFEGYGFQWIDNINNDEDRKIAEQIVGISKSEADKILRPYLESQLLNHDSRLNKFIKIAEYDFEEKYNKACLALEKITNHEMVSNNFIFYVTTFPRAQYNYEKRTIMMYTSTMGVWGMPIDGFLHEALHFQFTKYWRENSQSPVSKIENDKFHYLKEALTIVLDEDLRPIISTIDKGYPSQADFCKILHTYWEDSHNFSDLVDYGLKNLDDFYKA